MAYTALDNFAEADIGAGYVGIDRWQGGGFDEEEGEPEDYLGIAEDADVGRTMVVPVGDAETVVQTINLISHALRTQNNLVPPVIDHMQGGVTDDVNGAVRQDNCYIDTLRLSCAMNGPLMAAYTWKALGAAPVLVAYGARAALQTNTMVMWFTADVQVGGVGYKCDSWEATLSNNLNPWASEDVGTPTELRWPEEMLPGVHEVGFSGEFRLPSNINLMVDRPPVFTFLFTGVDNEVAPKTFTLDMTGGKGLHMVRRPRRIETGANEILWAVEAKAVPKDLAIWNVTFA